MDVWPWTKIEQRPDGHDRERCGAMRYEHVWIDCVAHLDAPVRLPSSEIVRRLRSIDEWLGIPTGVPLPVLLTLLDDPWTAERAARNPQITNELAQGLISRRW
jgi:hypothetical protein